jgi:hypothetical protein
MAKKLTKKEKELKELIEILNRCNNLGNYSLGKEREKAVDESTKKMLFLIGFFLFLMLVVYFFVEVLLKWQ